MRRLKITTGILPLFRLFVLLRLLWSLFALLILFGRFNLLTLQGSIFASFGECLLLIVYLFCPGLEKKLGRFYLPLGLVIATLGPWMENMMMLFNFPVSTVVFPHTSGLSSSSINSILVLSSQMQLAFLLLIPLVLISWQYRLRWVVIYSLGMAVLDFIQIFLFLSPRKEFFGGIPGSAIAMTCLFLIIGFFVNRLSTEQKEKNRQLGQYADTLERLATSRERNRIAREIHDTLAHTLSGLAVNLEAVTALWDSDSIQARNIIQQSLGVTRNGLVETRRAIQALRAGPLEDLGLINAIKQLALSSADRYGLKLELHLPPSLEGLDPVIEQCIYRIVEEGVHNTCNHARAGSFSLSLKKDGSQLVLELTDDGIGFKNNDPDDKEHFGIRGMKERAETIGGMINITNLKDGGTSIKFTIENLQK